MILKFWILVTSNQLLWVMDLWISVFLSATDQASFLFIQKVCYLKKIKAEAELLWYKYEGGSGDVDCDDSRYVDFIGCWICLFMSLF